MATSTTPSADLEFFFDPVCPFAWITSRWVKEVATQRPLDVRWRFISLAILNRDTDYSTFPPTYPDLHRLGTRLLRVAAAARRSVDASGGDGNEAVDRLYTAAGERLHNGGVSFAVFGGVPLPAGIVDDIIAAAGLDASLVAAADDDSFDEVLAVETELALSRAGRDVGTPILTFSPGGDDECSLFGPVISSIPRGAKAVELWDAVETLARTPGFAEFKRSLRDDLSFD